jgi:hypothetical protein
MADAAGDEIIKVSAFRNQFQHDFCDLSEIGVQSELEKFHLRMITVEYDNESPTEIRAEAVRMSADETLLNCFNEDLVEGRDVSGMGDN